MWTNRVMALKALKDIFEKYNISIWFDSDGKHILEIDGKEYDLSICHVGNFYHTDISEILESEKRSKT